MSDQGYAPWPEGYESLEVAEITHVAYVPDKRQAVILFTSTMGQKVALLAPLAHLNRVLMQLQSDPMQTRARLDVVSGGKDGAG